MASGYLSEHRPARIAFPGWVIFLPPRAAAATFLLDGKRFGYSGSEPSWAGGCGWRAELGVCLRVERVSQGPSQTENGLSNEDMLDGRVRAAQFWRGGYSSDNVSDDNNTGGRGTSVALLVT